MSSGSRTPPRPSSPLDFLEVGNLQIAVSHVRVLIVDDDDEVRRALAHSLARIGFQVHAANGGDTAVALAETSSFDLAIVDYEMPTPGLQVIQRLRSIFGSAIWIMVLSGHDDEDTRNKCFRAGADDFVNKPIPFVDLRGRLLSAVRSQQAYVESRIELERADRQLAYGAEATAMLAHDLNNGLGVALSNLSYLRGTVELDEDQSEALAATASAVRRVSVLLANFLDTARFEDAAVKPRIGHANVLELLREAAEAHPISALRRIGVEIECASGLVGTLDPELIGRVLANLVGNASRYCKPGGVIRLTARADADGIELAVFNTGAPIPDELAAQLFAKYQTGAGGRRGFGLYFCKLACEAHGGNIRYVASADGPTFTLRLPCKELP